MKPIPLTPIDLSLPETQLWQRLFATTSTELIADFEEYHRQNPHIYQKFAEKAAVARSSGRNCYSAWVIINVLRWEHDIQTASIEFKISNDHIAMYARCLVWNDPTFEGFFSLKQMKPSRSIRKSVEPVIKAPRGFLFDCRARS